MPLPPTNHQKHVRVEECKVPGLELKGGLEFKVLGRLGQVPDTA